MKSKNHPSVSFEAPAVSYEYLLVISPPEKVWKEVMNIKGQFHQQHNHIQAIKSKPHITLINFIANIAAEEILVLKIGDIATLYEAFEVMLKGVNHFQEHTIFLEITDQNFIIRIVKSLQKALKPFLEKSFFSLRPHMTLAKGLGSNKFQEAIIELAHLDYSSSFVADKIVLMKRERGPFNKYEIVKEFKLGIK